ncbi:MULTISPECIES: Na/Pi cotransporter family protein [unclassified Ruegeria]|uniref:Na/Pi cotransporter family protein n=1 Tax=unclassified Ruegeria TaxID=2625375 RepID=UPI00148863C6|nr:MULTISPECIES: Na/Pi cotransporter family protein [unclassified Ruegeria]NOC43900.1 Na/Pi cotransporter family protein [Ruegeria sp. HKCCD7559]
MSNKTTRLLPYFFVFFAFLSFNAAFAQSAELAEQRLDWLQLGMGLFGGLALFLAGLDLLSEGLKKAAGNTLRDVLQKLTVNRFMGAATGAFVTGILNSSSVTTVLVVGFVTAGVMTLAQSVGVIMGANIGSTVTAQLLAFDLSAYSLIAVALGFFMTFGSKNERPKYIGMMIMGLGLVFYGMGLMSDGMKPLRSYEPFLEILASMEQPLFGILAGALFTGLVQSSAATVGIAIAMASEGLLSLQAGIVLALGANIGTCVTALLAALGKPVEAVRASVVHVLFNIAGVLIWLPFLGILADIAVNVSPAAADSLIGKDKLAAEVPRQIANANTIFNVLNTIIFIGFATAFARLAERLVPERPEPKEKIIQPEFLDDGALEAPTIALENARREIERVGHIALEMMDTLGEGAEHHDRDALDAVARRDDEVDILTSEIMKYLGRLLQSSLTESESETHHKLVAAIMNIESTADIVETDMVELIKNFIDGDYAESSETTRDMVQGLWKCVRESLELAVRAVGNKDERSAQEVLLLKDDIRTLSDQLFERHAKRLNIDEPRYLERVRLLMTFIEQLRHMYTLTKRVAKTQLPIEVATDAT